MLNTQIPTSSILENGVHVVDIIRQIATQDGLKEVLESLAEQKKELEAIAASNHADAAKLAEDRAALTKFRQQLEEAQKEIDHRTADLALQEDKVAERIATANAKESALVTNIANFEAEVARQKSVNETIITDAAEKVALAEKLTEEAQAVKAEYEQKVEALKRAVV